MVLRESGLTETLNSAKFILGFTDTETVMLDLDNTSLKSVKYWASRTMKWFKLGGFIILRSSKDNYHVVFDRPVSWSENMKIVAWVAQLSNNPMLQTWHRMQCIKEGSTLRISNKREKPSPRIVYRYGSQNGQIEEFLSYRRLGKQILRKFTEDIVIPADGLARVDG